MLTHAQARATARLWGATTDRRVKACACVQLNAYLAEFPMRARAEIVRELVGIAAEAGKMK